MESTNPGYRRLAILPLLLLVLPAVAVAQTTIPAGVSADWWSHVQRDITQHEYHASVTEQGLVAPNRAHGLRTTFSESGIAVVPRTREGVAPAWRFAWTTRSFGRPGSEFGVAAVSPVSTGDRVTYRREGFSEWYVNTAAGLEQGFTI